MKHILNDLTEQEKNSIREQHTGGMKVMTESFSKLINSKLGDVKPLVSEQTLPSSGTTSGETTTNPFKNPDLLKKFVGKQFNVYNDEDEDTSRKGLALDPSKGQANDTFEIKNAYYDAIRDVIFDIVLKNETESLSLLLGPKTASFSCRYPDTLLIKTDNDEYLVASPSLTKELKQTFCTVGSYGKLVPKVDYPTP